MAHLIASGQNLSVRQMTLDGLNKAKFNYKNFLFLMGISINCSNVEKQKHWQSEV
jgi:hypothetical protein